MSTKLCVEINGKDVFKYEKSPRLPGKKRQILDNIDRSLDDGIEINGNYINGPDKMQRAQYVSMNLLHALETDNERLVSSSCDYLVTRLSELSLIKVVENGNEVTMNLVFNKE